MYMSVQSACISVYPPCASQVVEEPVLEPWIWIYKWLWASMCLSLCLFPHPALPCFKPTPKVVLPVRTDWLGWEGWTPRDTAPSALCFDWSCCFCSLSLLIQLLPAWALLRWSARATGLRFQEGNWKIGIHLHLFYSELEELLFFIRKRFVSKECFLLNPRTCLEIRCRLNKYVVCS